MALIRPPRPRFEPNARNRLPELAGLAAGLAVALAAGLAQLEAARQL